LKILKISILYHFICRLDETSDDSDDGELSDDSDDSEIIPYDQIPDGCETATRNGLPILDLFNLSCCEVLRAVILFLHKHRNKEKVKILTGRGLHRNGLPKIMDSVSDILKRQGLIFTADVGFGALDVFMPHKSKDPKHSPKSVSRCELM